MVTRVTSEDCAYVVQRLQRAAAFAQRIGAPPHSEEHASLHALKLFISMTVFLITLIAQFKKKPVEPVFAYKLCLSIYLYILGKFTV